MKRNVTAVYRSLAVADLVRKDLESLGISRGHIHVLPDADETARKSGPEADRRLMDEFHDLHLPEDDLRTYQRSVRRGDYVVSVNVDDERIQRVQEIMRRPEAEAHDLDALNNEFREGVVVAHSDTSRSASDPRLVGQRDLDQKDPYLRSYKRDISATERSPR
ncbi:hypothetical protein VQ042_19260 [Aurantimonas sp. A2-1-M11]|uniref:hypothetical protein n=1 Tax=Aurantimonas sp. A2-1-M11 TaxID=3113712 RepID=UPI002F9342F1